MSTRIVTLEGGTPIGVDQGTLSRMALDRQFTPDSVVKDDQSQTEYRACSIPGLFLRKAGWSLLSSLSFWVIWGLTFFTLAGWGWGF